MMSGACALEHELSAAPTEKGKPLVVIRVPVENPALEEILVECGSMKKHLRP